MDSRRGGMREDEAGWWTPPRSHTLPRKRHGIAWLFHTPHGWWRTWGMIWEVLYTKKVLFLQVFVLHKFGSENYCETSFRISKGRSS